MAIDFNIFYDWADSRFKKVLVKGSEIRINSIFAEDENCHLWCSPSGGKNNRFFGVYHCFKTDQKGSLVSLVMQVDKCSKIEALQTLGIEKYKGKPIEEISEEEDYEIFNVDNIKFNFLSLPVEAKEIRLLPSSWYESASNYIKSRGFDTNKFYFCFGGRYHGRVLIPYYWKNKELIYYNCRSIINQQPKYLGPPKECGVGKDDVLFFTSYPKSGEKIFLCEGELDALTLSLLGYNACACGGKNLSDRQALLLSEYRICLSLDFDEAGKNALSVMYKKLCSFSLMDPHNRISVCLPPEVSKDWNKFYLDYGGKMVSEYIKLKEHIWEESDNYANN